MNWELFYLICFVVGFAFCAISFLGGTHLHLPKGGAHLGGMHVGGHGAAGPCHTTVHSAGHGPGAAHASGDGHAQRHGAHFSVINPITLAAFLTWFGGTGYLILHFRPIWIFAGLVMAMLAGMAGASLVFWFVVKVLLGHERDLNPMDYEMVGVLGKVSNTIRAKGTGEMIYVQEGVRRPCAARSEAGTPLDKGEEVVVTRYEHGIAYVRRWEDMAGPETTSTQLTAGQ